MSRRSRAEPEEPAAWKSGDKAWVRYDKPFECELVARRGGKYGEWTVRWENGDVEPKSVPERLLMRTVPDDEEDEILSMVEELRSDDAVTRRNAVGDINVILEIGGVDRKTMPEERKQYRDDHRKLVEAGAIKPLVSLLRGDCRGSAAFCLYNLTRREYLDHDSQETIDAIVGAGAIPMLVELVPEGPTERELDFWDGASQVQVFAVAALENLMHNHEDRLVEAGAVEALVEVFKNENPYGFQGLTGTSEAAHVGRNLPFTTANMLWHLVRGKPDKQRSLTKGEGLFQTLVAILHDHLHSDNVNNIFVLRLLSLWEAPLASQIRDLESENTVLRQRLSRHEGVVDVTGDGGDAPSVENKLREEHGRATNARLVKVKEEKADAEGARDRTDAIAAEASVAAASERERADDQGTNAMYLHTQKSELQRLVSDAANALLDSDADVPTKEVDDDATPFYYMLESHRDDGKQTVLWYVEADRAMTLAEGIAWIQNNRPNKRPRRR